MVISTLLDVHTIESTATEILVLGVKPKLVLPRKSRAITLLSKARTSGECCATTAANAKAVGPDAVTGPARAARGAAIMKSAITMNLIISVRVRRLSLFMIQPSSDRANQAGNRARRYEIQNNEDISKVFAVTRFPNQSRISPYFCDCDDFSGKRHRRAQCAPGSEARDRAGAPRYQAGRGGLSILSAIRRRTRCDTTHRQNHPR
jgi:hypothetical protein